MMLYDVYLDIDILKNPGINCFFNKELSMVHALNPPPQKKNKTKQTNKNKNKNKQKQTKIQQQTESQRDKHNHKQKVIKKPKRLKESKE